MNIINPEQINHLLTTITAPSQDELTQILQKSQQLKRLNLTEVATLIKVQNPAQIQQILDAANHVKNTIYGNRIVFFAPLYISNYCQNDCAYCAFKISNKITRHALNTEELIQETTLLINQGHKRILMVAGESYPAGNGLDYVLNAIDTIYSVKVGKNSIRRINVNIAPLTAEEFAKLKQKNIGTYQLFQETYHLPTYQKVHTKGPKADYNFRLTAIDRAIEAGIDDVGLGVLYGLYDWQFETLALLSHVEYLEQKFGLGPHTISVPRLEPAEGVDLTTTAPNQVSDDDFKKIIAILRLAVPYTGLILSTRENPEIRQAGLHLGISQISAGSRTNPGGYTAQKSELQQFSLGDHRDLDEVIYDLLQMNFIPSFCTACYRLGRTGLDFMEYAKPGDIKKKCEPNALMTFTEYLNDFASPQTKILGQTVVKQKTAEITDEKTKKMVQNYLDQINQGNRDLYI